MPAPLVIPARLKVVPGCEGSVKVRETSFGKVSVVQIARAVLSQAACVLAREDAAEGILARILEIGRLSTC